MGAMRTPSSRASKWAATWYVESSGPKPLMASLIQTQSRGWPLKVLDLNSQHIKRGLISKLWMRAFSWHPSNPLNSFFAISAFSAGLCYQQIFLWKQTNSVLFQSLEVLVQEVQTKSCDVAGTIQGYHWLCVARYLHWEPIHPCKQRSSSHGKGLWPLDWQKGHVWH